MTAMRVKRVALFKAVKIKTMRKSKRKIREAKELEKSFKVEYKSGVDKRLYWTVIHSRNKLEVVDIFKNKLYTDASEILEDEKGNKNIFEIV